MSNKYTFRKKKCTSKLHSIVVVCGGGRRPSSTKKPAAAHTMVAKLLALSLLVAAGSASVLPQARPAIVTRSKESAALKLRGGSTVTKAPSQPKALRGGGAKPLFMGVDTALLGYFAGWCTAAPRHPSVRARAAPHACSPSQTRVSRGCPSLSQRSSQPHVLKLSGTCSTTTTQSIVPPHVKGREGLVHARWASLPL